MAKAGSKSSTDFDYAAYVLREAKLGHTAPLAGYLRFCAGWPGGRPLPPELSEYLAERLERFDGKPGKAEFKRIEKELIRQQVNGLVEGEGLEKEAAVAEVMRWRGLSRSKVYLALAESKTRK
jgi:hypothetical protein